jgi:hypothetical protein
MHKRAVIRNYVLNLLLNNTAAGSRVYGKRVDSAPASDAPYIVIKARRDRVLVLHGEEPPTYQRKLVLQINIVTKGDEDVANDLADDVEGLILKDFTLGKNAVRAVLNDTELDPDASGADVYWDASINIDVDYISTFA